MHDRSYIEAIYNTIHRCRDSYQRLVSCDEGWQGWQGKTGYVRKVAIVLAKSGKGNRSPPPCHARVTFFLPPFPFLPSSLFSSPFSQVNSCEISIRHGSMEHINKKSFPACTRVTAHATFSQPLQPISLAFTSRQRRGEVLHRRWVERAAPVEQRMSELRRVVEGGGGMRKRRARGTEIMLRDLWMEGGRGVKPTAYYERNISLKNHPHTPSTPVSLPPCLVLSITRPCTSTSGIDSLAILPLTIG